MSSDTPKITQESIKQICKEHKDYLTLIYDILIYRYNTVEQNEKQFLNYRGYRKIENLNSLVNVRTLFLDSNMIESVEGLDCLLELRNLFLQNNVLKDIKGLELCTKLDSLDLSQNEIENINVLHNLINLRSQNQSNNKISDIAGVKDQKNLRDLNISHNLLQDFDSFVSVLQTTNVRSLICMHNPFYEADANIRKKLICRLPNLRFINDRTVSADERRICLAWEKDGMEGERKERENTSVLRKAKEDSMVKSNSMSNNTNNIEYSEEEMDSTDLPLLEELDLNNIDKIRKLGNAPKVLGSVEGLLLPSNRSVMDPNSALHDKNVEYSIVNPVKLRNYTGSSQYTDYLNHDANYISQDKEHMEGWVHGSEAKQSGAKWPEWLDNAQLEIAEECECLWHEISEHIQARICAKLRTQEDPTVDTASVYNSDECRLRYFEQMFSDSEEDQDFQHDQDTTDKVDMHALDE